MPSYVTLSELRTKIRRRAGIRNQTGFIDNDELNDVINEARERLYNKIVLVQTQELFRDSWSFSTNATDSSYEIAPDFFRLISVDAVLSDNDSQTITARPYMERDRNAFKWMNIWTWGYPAWYRLVGKKINFIPDPGAAYDVTIHYVPTCKKLVNDGDALDSVNGWDAWLVWVGVAHCKAKGDEDPSYAIGQAKEMEGDILALAAARDVNGPERVVDSIATNVGLHDWWS